jgi:predicted Zn-dependent peptidase
MEIIKNEKLGEEVIRITHKSGLEIAIIPKKGFSSIYAQFAAKVGSVDNCFKLKGEEQFTRIPDGIAHFLEHKMFDMEDGTNAFDQYAKTGASANAFTAFDKTAYLFSTTDHFKESLEVLVNCVTHPYFTKESVEKEQGIIGQEIRMYDDNGEWRVLFNLLECLYQHNPVRIDIAGTVESIAKIDHELLYRCYRTFYNLHNMILCVVGDVKVEDVLEVCDKYLEPAEPQEIICDYGPAETGLHSTYHEQQLPVASPLFQLGFKDNYTNCEGREFLKREAAMGILLSMLVGRSSDFYEEMYRQGLINSSFGSEYFWGRGFASAIMGGESKDPQKVQQHLLSAIEKMKQNPDDELFQRCKRAVYASTVQMFNSVENIAVQYVGYYFAKADFFQVLDVFDEVTLDDVMTLLDQVFQKENMALSVVRPVDKA